MSNNPVRFQIIDSQNKDFSPLLYCHNMGYDEDLEEIIRAWQRQMGNEVARLSLSFGFARLVECAINQHNCNLGGNLGFGVENEEYPITDFLVNIDGELKLPESAGKWVVIDIAKDRVTVL